MNEMDIIDFIKSEIEQGKTRTEVAKELKVNRSTIYRWLKGITRPSAKSIGKFEKYLKKLVYDHVVIYGIARQFKNHDLYVPLDVSFCIPQGLLDDRDIQKMVDNYLQTRGLIPVNYLDQSYNVVSIMEVSYNYCNVILHNEKEVYNYIKDNINTTNFRVYKKKYQKTKSLYRDDWLKE